MNFPADFVIEDVTTQVCKQYFVCLTVKKEVLHKFAELSIQDRNEVVEKQALKAVAGKVGMLK